MVAVLIRDHAVADHTRVVAAADRVARRNLYPHCVNRILPHAGHHVRAVSRVITVSVRGHVARPHTVRPVRVIVAVPDRGVKHDPVPDLDVRLALDRVVRHVLVQSQGHDHDQTTATSVANQLRQGLAENLRKKSDLQATDDVMRPVVIAIAHQHETRNGLSQVGIVQIVVKPNGLRKEITESQDQAVARTGGQTAKKVTDDRRVALKSVRRAVISINDHQVVVVNIQ